MNITIGQQLRTLRKGQKLTQQYVADKVGITRSTLSNYEIDRRVAYKRTSGHPHASLHASFTRGEITE